MFSVSSIPRDGQQKPESRETARRYYAALDSVCDPKALSAMISERDEVSRGTPVFAGGGYNTRRRSFVCKNSWCKCGRCCIVCSWRPFGDVVLGIYMPVGFVGEVQEALGGEPQRLGVEFFILF